MDRILIQGLRLKGHVGVTEEERARPQLLGVDVEVRTDLGRAGTSDDLADTIDYGELLDLIAGIVGDRRSRLLESLAEQIASAIASLEGVSGVTVEIGKEDPPVDQEVDRVAVRIERAAG